MTLTQIPKHVAIMMDGNGRWAEQRGKPRFFGHQAGAKNIENVVNVAVKQGVEVLTLWGLSTENWLKRPKDEINFLLDLGFTYLKDNLDRLSEQKIQLHVIGDISSFPEKVQKLMKDAVEKTAHNSGLKLVMALNYGGHWDILQAVKKLAVHVEKKELKAVEIKEEDFTQYLSLHAFPHVDLIIRTSGEFRLSNFCLWDIAYAELYFTETYWPDFNEKEFLKALKVFSKRNRRFGGLDKNKT